MPPVSCAEQPARDDYRFHSLQEASLKAPQVETPEEKSFYRVRSLTSERYEQLLAIKEEARQTIAHIYSPPYCAGPGNGPDNLGCLEGFDYEIELIEATRALAETIDLLHRGCAPENVLGAVELDEVFWIAGTSVSDILGMYRTVSSDWQNQHLGAACGA